MFEDKHWDVPMINGDYLKGRTAFITGGTRGIGLCIARQFLDNGASVLITGINDEEVGTAVQRLQSHIQEGNKACGIVMDNSKVETFDACFSTAQSLIAPRKFDILINNAGINGSGSFGNITSDVFDAVIAVNLKGAFFISQLFSHYMVDNHIKGNILNIASSSSLRPAVTPYTLSKWGIRGLTQGLAKTLVKYGITVNAVAPGPTATDMMKVNGYDGTSLEFKNVPTGRFVAPEEVANTVTFLVSDMGRMIIGDVVYITGGPGIITFDDVQYDVW